MASIIDTYTARRYYQLSKDQLTIPKYIKPLKENSQYKTQSPRIDIKNGSMKTSNVALKKSNSDLQNLIIPIANHSVSKLKVRLLVYIEDSDGSRSNIFDSEKYEFSHKNSPKKQASISRSMPKATSISSTSTKLDNEMIKRMVFGSFPMKISNNTAIKVHSLKNSNKTMISNVFTFYDNSMSSSNHDSCYCDSTSNVNYQSSEAASPASSFSNNNQKTQTIPIKKSSLTSCSIQSSCSFNTSSTNNFNLVSPSNSVPTGMFYGSYAGIYKRLMRSVSNSLISDSTTVQNKSIIESLDDALNINEFNNNSVPVIDPTPSRNDTNECEKKSLSAYSNNGSCSIHQTLCEKCVENNCYPKYKIGVAIVFCLPTRQRNASISASSCVSTSTVSNGSGSPNNVTTPLTHSNSINIDQANKQKINTNSPFDHIEMFPASETPSPNLPSSPVHHNTPPKTDISNFLGTASTHENEVFYEFFFSHLPLIEFQLKELIEKITQNLPAYFINSSRYSKNSHRISIPSQNGSLTNSNRTSTSSLNGSFQTISFTKRVFADFEEYERKFNLLYSSPRLQRPAWLSLIKSKSSKKNPNEKSSCSLSNSLINNFVHLNNFYEKNSNEINNGSSSFILLNKLDFKKSLFRSPIEKTHDKEKFFFKNILSTLLSNHLSWVMTVLPSTELNDDSSGLNLRKQQANWTRILEKTNPYNPLWAQLGDLHGAVNQPLKLVRCVVLGKNREFVEKILLLCSYFIRCSNSSYFDIQQENFDFNYLKTKQESSIRIDLKEISELKFDPVVQLTNVLNSSSISSSSRSGSSGPMSPTCTSPFPLSPVSSKSFKNNISSTTNAQELPLIGCKLKQNHFKSTRMQDNFGYSLLASYCDEFVFEFVLHGTSDTSFLESLQQRLVFSKKNSILDCPISESIYIVIDSDQFQVKVYSSESSKPVLVEKPISLVDSLVQSVIGMVDLFQNSEFVLLHLEDKLQEFYTKSVTMNQLKCQLQGISDEKLSQLLDINDPNDLEFLKQIHSATTIPNFF